MDKQHIKYIRRLISDEEKERKQTSPSATNIFLSGPGFNSDSEDSDSEDYFSKAETTAAIYDDWDPYEEFVDLFSSSEEDKLVYQIEDIEKFSHRQVRDNIREYQSFYDDDRFGRRPIPEGESSSEDEEDENHNRLNYIADRNEITSSYNFDLTEEEDDEDEENITEDGETEISEDILVGDQSEDNEVASRRNMVEIESLVGVCVIVAFTFFLSIMMNMYLLFMSYFG